MTVIGCLNFDNTKSQKFHAEQIHVFGGKLTVGTSSAPITKKTEIVLYGDYDGQFITMPGAVEAGNKMIANVGQVVMVGANRDRMSRLHAEVFKGSTSATVDAGLDWVAGDKLGFAPTATQHTHYEVATIASYDIATGALTLTAPLLYYHFGAAASTGANYQGLEMRGEVILLTRNIVIRGDQSANTWNGQFLTMDSTVFKPDGTSTTYQGLATLKNVEFYKMGQLNNQHAGLRFEGNKVADNSPAFSTVENCVIHESAGWGVSVTNSNNISLKNIDVFDVE